MAWVDHTFALPWDVVWYWGCVPLPEQQAAGDIAIVSGSPFPYAVAALVDAYFFVASPLWWEKRLAAWRGNWDVQEEEIDIDGITVRLYTSSAAWVAALYGCILSDGCAAGDSACPTRPYYSGGGA